MEGRKEGRKMRLCLFISSFFGMQDGYEFGGFS